MAAKTQDYSKMFNDMINMFPVDMSAMQDSFKTYASFGEKMSKVALEAADKSTEIGSKYTKDTISKLGDVTKVKEDPQAYSKAMTDFASAQAEIGAEALAAYAEVAKKVQMETVELMLAAGKDMSEDATSAMKKASADVTSMTKKASSTAASTAKQA